MIGDCSARGLINRFQIIISGPRQILGNNSIALATGEPHPLKTFMAQRSAADEAEHNARRAIARAGSCLRT
jgi:hypothetical protein